MPPQPTNVRELREPPNGAVFASFRLADTAGSVRLLLVGELDLATAERVREAFRSAQADTRVLICDLGDVWFVDMSGLVVLLDAAIRAEQIGGRLTFTNCPPIVPRMLALLKLEDQLEIQAAPCVTAAAAPCCARRRRHVSQRRSPNE